MLKSNAGKRTLGLFCLEPKLRLKKARQYSATKIQAGFRGFKGRNIAKEAKAAAATKIQAMARGNLVRIRNKSLNQKSK